MIVRSLAWDSASSVMAAWWRAVLADPSSRLDVVLPLTLEDYLEDFTTEESRKEFGELLGRCRKPVLLVGLLLPSCKWFVTKRHDWETRLQITHCTAARSLWWSVRSGFRGPLLSGIDRERDRQTPASPVRHREGVACSPRRCGRDIPLELRGRLIAPPRQRKRRAARRATDRVEKGQRDGKR